MRRINPLIAVPKGIAYTASFVWKNIPTLKEAFITSSIQSLLEIILDVDKYFSGSHPAEKSIVRNALRPIGEYKLASQKDNYGDTKYWHDEVSLFSTIQKPMLQGSTIVAYKYLFDQDTASYVETLELLIQENNNGTALEIPEQVQNLSGEYLNQGILGEASRFSNFVGEPIARIIDGCSKTRQNAILETFKQAGGDVANREALIRYISDNKIGFWGVPGYVIQNGLKEAPYGVTYSVLKTAGIDALGKVYSKTPAIELIPGFITSILDYLGQYTGLYFLAKKAGLDYIAEGTWKNDILETNESIIRYIGLDYFEKLYKEEGLLAREEKLSKKTIKESFALARKLADKKLLSYFDDDLDNLQDLSFYERKDAIFSQEDLTTPIKYTLTAATFLSELVEKTGYNMVTMWALSTPNKALGNTLHIFDKAAPNLFRPVGIAAGVYYIKSEFFDPKKKDTLAQFVEKQKIKLTPEESCYVKFIDDTTSDESSNKLSLEKSGPAVEELVKCLVEITPDVPDGSPDAV